MNKLTILAVIIGALLILNYVDDLYQAQKEENVLPIDGEKMRAVIYKQYGGPEVLQLVNVAKPSAGDDEILVKVNVTTVTTADIKIRAFDFPDYVFWFFGRLVFGVKRPAQQILGTEFAGEVVTVGKNVEGFKVGDRVLSFPGGLLGAYAEYVVVKADGVVVKIPEGLDYKDAVSLPFGVGTSIYYLSDLASVKKGDKVLIYGASGCVGASSVQYAKYLGAEVTAVCGTRNVELMKMLGADHVIDYTKEDFAKNGKTYDFIYETIGKVSYEHSVDSLTENGIFLANVMTTFDFFTIAKTSMTEGKKFVGGVAPERVEDLHLIMKLALSGDLVPVIDNHQFSIEQMAEAHKYVEEGHKTGSLVVSF